MEVTSLSLISCLFSSQRTDFAAAADDDDDDDNYAEEQEVGLLEHYEKLESASQSDNSERGSAMLLHGGPSSRRK